MEVAWLIQTNARMLLYPDGFVSGVHNFRRHLLLQARDWKLSDGGGGLEYRALQLDPSHIGGHLLSTELKHELWAARRRKGDELYVTLTLSATLCGYISMICALGRLPAGSLLPFVL